MTAHLVTRTRDGRIVDQRTVHGSRPFVLDRAETTRLAVAEARGLDPDDLATKVTPVSVVTPASGDYLPTTPAR